MSRSSLVCALALSLGALPVPARAYAQRARQQNPTALCKDGTSYFGRPVRGVACARHRGVSEWLARPQATQRTPATARRRAAPRRPATAPQRAVRIPKGATALCRDGTYSLLRDRRQACGGHGGVVRWLRR